MATSVISSLESLLIKFSDDSEIHASLQNIKGTVNACFDALPSQLLLELHPVLQFLVELKSETATMSTEIVDLKQKLVTVEDEMKAIQKKYEDSQHKNEDLQQELLAVQKKYENSQTEYKDSQKKYEDSMQEFYAVQKKYENSQEKYEDSQQKNEDLQQELLAMQKKYENSQTEYKDSQKKYEDSRQEFHALQEKYENSQKKFEDSLGKYKGSQQQLHAVKKELDTSQELCALRQMYFAVNEKVVRKAASLADMSMEEVYQQRIPNVGQIGRSEKLMAAWETLQKMHDFSDSPSRFWRSLKDCREHYDVFVHQKSFPQYTFAQLEAVGKREYVGDKQQYYADFDWFFRLNKTLSEEKNIQWFEY